MTKRKAGKMANTFDLRSDYIGVPELAGSIEVANPHNGQQKTIVYRSLRDDPLGRLQDRRQIDEAQYMAGRHWQKQYETAEICGARAIDPTREAVDGGQIASSAITDEQARAFADLARAGRVLGMIGESVVRDVLANRMFPEAVAKSRGYRNQRSVDYYSRLFRDCLNTLAVEFGYATRR